MSKTFKMMLLAAAILLVAVNAWALPSAGDWVEMSSGDYRQPGFSGGEFKMTTELGDEYAVFCVEKDEFIGLDRTYYVDSVEDYATGGGGGAVGGKDYLSDESRWLYAGYFSGLFGGRSNLTVKWVQEAVWFQEDEITDDSAWIELSGKGSYATTSDIITGWDIKVVNLVNDNGDGVQSQIVGAPVPEPATMLLLGTGLIGMAGMSRRRLKK